MVLNVPICYREPIIHGDVKPSNILLDTWGNARLGDAGLAVEMPKDRSHCTGTNTYAGTQPFRDPYADDDERKPCNDIFSLGVGL